MYLKLGKQKKLDWQAIYRNTDFVDNNALQEELI
jgi:hypothetical protein